MKESELAKAVETLQEPEQKPQKKLLWVIIGLVIGSVFILLLIVFLWFRGILTGETPGGSGTYPYIPVPKHTFRSTSVHELISNLLLDTNDTGIDYSVLSRKDIQRW